MLGSNGDRRLSFYKSALILVQKLKNDGDENHGCTKPDAKISPPIRTNNEDDTEYEKDRSNIHMLSCQKIHANNRCYEPVKEIPFWLKELIEWF